MTTSTDTTEQPAAQLLLFEELPSRKDLRRYGPCNNPLQPHFMAPPYPDDTADAVGLQSQDYCCVVHYVRHLRWKYELDT